MVDNLGMELPESLSGLGREEREAAEEVLSILEKNIVPERVEAVLNTPAEVYAGKTVLEALAENPKQTLEKVRQSFDWSTHA